MSWKRCLDEFNARKITVDKQRALSLKKMALNRKEFINSIPETDNNLKFIFESYYTLVIEILHSLAYEKGYNIENHVCLGFFLVEFYNLEKEQKLFDKFRKNRNGLVYYGNELSKQVLEKNIVEIREFVKLIETIKN